MIFSLIPAQLTLHHSIYPSTHLSILSLSLFLLVSLLGIPNFHLLDTCPWIEDDPSQAKDRVTSEIVPDSSKYEKEVKEELGNQKEGKGATVSQDGSKDADVSDEKAIEGDSMTSPLSAELESRMEMKETRKISLSLSLTLFSHLHSNIHSCFLYVKEYMKLCLPFPHVFKIVHFLMHFHVSLTVRREFPHP